ncbi:MAG TPA: translocation/assembly module TamB domain-containing protein [Steroidobacteraceae bacterium]
MRWPPRKVTRWLLAILVLAVAALGLGAAWLLTTEAGLARAIAMLESLDKVKIRVTGANGRLIGPLAAATIDIEHPRATIRIAGFAADYEPSEILAGRISAESVSAATVTIHVHERPETQKPPGFMPGWLTLVIDEAEFAALRIVSPGGTATNLVDVRGSATVSRTQIEFEDGHADAGSWAIAGAGGRLYAREPVALEANAAWSLTSGRDIAGVLRATGDLDRLQVDARIAAPGIAQARLELTDLTGNLRWHGETQIERLDLAQWIDPAPLGPLRGTLSMQGDRFTYAATGVMHGDGLPATGVRVVGTARYADLVVTFDQVTLSVPGATTLQMQGTMNVAAQPAYEVQAQWSDFRWPLTGAAVLNSANGTLQADGWREFNYRVAGNFVAAGAPPFSGHASGRFTETQMIVEESAWQTLGGHVVAQGMLSRDANRAWTLTGRARQIDPATLRKELPGRLAFRFAASGKGLDEKAEWAASVTNLSGPFRGQPASGGGIVRRQDDRLQFERVALALGPARLQLDGTWGREPDLDARLLASDLSRFLPELGGSIDAVLEMRRSAITLAFAGHDLAWGDHRAIILSADAHVDLENRKHSWLRLRSNGLTIAGQPLTDTRLSFDGLLRDHAMEFRVGMGDDTVELLGRGSYAAGRFRLQLQQVSATGPRTAPWKLEAPVSLSATRHEARLEPACFVQGARRACMNGRWRRNADWAFNASTQAFPLETLDLKVPGKPRYRGLLSVDARASGRAGEPWLADVRAEIRDAVLEYQSASGTPRSVALGRTLLTMQSLADRHLLDLSVVDAADIELAAEITATRVAGLSFGELPVSGTVRGATRQLGLLPLLVEDIDLASGRLALDFSVGGRLGAPSLEGEARLTEGALDFYPVNLRLRDLRATMKLHETALELKATATAGAGSLDIDGRLGWRERRLTGELALKGERLLLVDVPEAHVYASPDLRFVLADRRIDITGSVSIPQAQIEPAETAGAVLTSADERIIGPETGSDDAEAFDVVSDVRLLLGGQVRIDAYGLSGRITGSVRARSTPHEAAVATGELQIQDGEYRAYTRALDVERGRLLFTGGPVTDPGVDLRASRKLPGYTVGVIVRGRLRRPQLTLFSTPSLPQAQIASLLIVGRSLDSLQSEDRASLESESASVAAQGGALLAGQLGRYVGLDDVGLSEDQDAGAALVLGKFLSPRLYVSYGISLVDQINTLKLRYTIGDRWVIAAESGAEAAADIEYRIER